MHWERIRQRIKSGGPDGRQLFIRVWLDAGWKDWFYDWLFPLLPREDQDIARFVIAEIRGAHLCDPDYPSRS